MKLWNYIKLKMLKNEEQIVCEGNEKTTYKELIDRVQKFSKEIKRKKCCAIICKSEMNSSIALLSCFAAGVTAVPLSLRYGEIHCNKILDTISPDAIITDKNSKLKVNSLENAKYNPPRIKPAIIMCTSGTTGNPKAAMLTEENILTNLNDICDYFDIGKEDYILISRPIYHCAVLTGEVLTSLVKGVKIRFFSEKLNPKKLIELIGEHGITAFCSTPTVLGMLARFKRNDSMASLKKICISGECMSKETGNRIATAFENADIYHVYGLTEACPRVSYLPPRLFKEHSDSVGMPLNSVFLRIIKPDGKMAATNEEGVLWVKGDNVMAGYYNAPEYTEKVLKNGWLCTGDMAMIDLDGLLRIKGRIDNLIIRAGMNIYPQEVESALKVDGRVQEALVYKIENEIAGVQIGLKISGDFGNVSEVRKLCAEILPEFQMPSVIELLTELPKNASGKIIRSVNNA